MITKIIKRTDQGWCVLSASLYPSGDVAFWQQSSPYFYRFGNLIRWIMKKGGNHENLPLILKNAKSTAERDGCNQRVYLSNDGELSFTGSYGQGIEGLIYVIKL